METNLYWVILTLACCAAVLVTEKLGKPTWEWGFKPLASCGFLGLGLAVGALEHLPGIWVFSGLVLSLLGDIFLISKRQLLFLGGLISFLLAHVAYIGAFWALGLDMGTAGIGLACITPISVIVGRWLLRSVPSEMRIPVIFYIVVITLMVAGAGGVTHHETGRELFIGALLFFISDLSVAIHRFVAPHWVHRLWGLPTYYIAQLYFAFGAIPLSVGI